MARTRKKASGSATKAVAGDNRFAVSLTITSVSEQGIGALKLPLVLQDMDQLECLLFWQAIHGFTGGLMKLAKEYGFAFDREKGKELYTVKVEVTITRGTVDGPMVMAVPGFVVPNLDREEMEMFWGAVHELEAELIHLSKEHGFALDQETTLPE